MMELITKQAEIFANINTLKRYLDGSGEDHEFASDLIRRGRCFVVTETSGRLFFAPSRFIGYRGNTRHHHTHDPGIHGTKTNAAIRAVLGKRPEPNDLLETEYRTFCDVKLKAAPNNVPHKFWDLR